ncbi:MAG: ATP-dependent sacrificial sulfur transferase LarE [Deltaproteobacteria bacterium]
MHEGTAGKKRAALLSRLEELESLLVAFSGGVDSSFLLAMAKEVLGKKVYAATAVSFIHPSKESEDAARIAHLLGVHHIRFASRETSLESFVANSKERCYYCKKAMFRQLFSLAEQAGLKMVVHGANRDDLRDYRPGLRAAEEAGAVAPLMDVELSKEEIRFLSREMGLQTWNKPSDACLASRIPYGTRITSEVVQRVDEAEKILRDKGFPEVRVRHYGAVAGIEVTRDGIHRFSDDALRTEIVERFRKLGFQTIALDLEGYVSGKMNRPLSSERSRGEKAWRMR